MHLWKHLSSRILFLHPRIKLIEEELELPSGGRIDWLSVDEGSDSVCIICLDDKRRVLVSRQYCPAPRAVVHEFPGGRIDPGESVEAAARRELREEAGIVCGEVQILGSYYPNNRRSPRQCCVVLTCKEDNTLCSPELEEIVESEWLPMEEVSRRLSLFKNGSLLAAWSLFLCSEK